MRIAIHHNLPSGGGKRALFEMVKRLAERHEIAVYTLATADHDFCDLRPFCTRHTVFPFRPLPLARRPFGRLNQGIRTLDLLRLQHLQRTVAAQVDHDGHDVIFVHNCRIGQSPSILQFLETSSAYYCQEPPRLLYEPPVPRPYSEFSRLQRLGNLADPLPGLYRRTLGRLDRENARAASRILVNSHYSRETLYRVYGVFVHVAYLGVDTDAFRPLRLPREGFVLSVGALTPRKGFDFLLRSLTLLPKGERPSLVIVSNFVDSRERAYLQALAAQLEVKLDIRAMAEDAELVRLYNQARLVLYAPVMEPFGFVPLEAMACGTPVVGVNEAGLRESVVHRRTGLLTDRDPHDFADAVVGLLRDGDRRDAYGIAGLEHVRQNWTWGRAVQSIEEQLLAACGSQETS